LYILTHAILNYCKVEILEIINNYFWFIFILDMASLVYGVYQNISIPTTDGTYNNLDVSFNLLKNQINTIGNYFNKKNNISITDTPVPTPRQPLRISTASFNTNSQPQPHPQPQLTNTSPTIMQHQQKNKQQSGYSTPITALRNLDIPVPSRNTTGSNIPEPIIISNENPYLNAEYGDGIAESVAGSDVGSIMDLEDFEKSL
jgi:hypothetical protein